jgi:hypothetical protein
MSVVFNKLILGGSDSMRISKLMGLAVFVVALAVTINALAYKTAVVTSGLSITVDTSANAELAIAAPTSADPGITTSVTNGKFSLVVDDIMQPDSVYTYHDALKVTNNASHTITLTCATTGFDAAISIALRDAADDSILCGTAFATTVSKEVRLEITVADTFTAGSLGTLAAGSLVLTGTR